MKKISFILMLVLAVGCNGKEKNIIKHTEVKEFKKAEDDFKEMGILTVSIDTPVKIYAHPKNINHFDEIIFNKITSGTEGGSHIIEIDEVLKPHKIYEGDTYISAPLGYVYPELKFRVLNKTDEYFEVLVNVDTKEIGYIKKEERRVFNFPELTNEMWNEIWKELKGNYFIFTTWKEYLKRAEFIITSRNCNIYDRINGNVIYEFEDNIFKVTDVQGDWLKGIPPFNRPRNTNKSGWIKWRDNGNLTIQVVEYTVE